MSKTIGSAEDDDQGYEGSTRTCLDQIIKY